LAPQSLTLGNVLWIDDRKFQAIIKLVKMVSKSTNYSFLFS